MAKPHYLSDTIASTLPPYFHSETERISNSFRSGTCWSVKQLPHILEYGEVQKRRHANATNNILQKPPRIYKAVVAKKNFWNIPYVPTTYEKHHILEKSAFEVDRNQIESTGRKPGLVIPSRIKAKYEDIFEDINYQYPQSVLGPAVGQPKLETIVREEFSDMQRFVCGKNSRSLLDRKVPDKELGVKWTRKIFELLSTDWAQLKFKVKFTKTDELLVQFEMLVDEQGLPKQGGALLTSLGKYMSTMVAHGVACEFGLRRRGDRWGQLEDPELSKSVSVVHSPGLFSPTGKHAMSSEEEESVIANGPGNDDLIDSIVEGASPASSKPDREVMFLDTGKVSESARVKLLTFSMYAPWVAAGSLNAMRAAAFADRQAARRRIDEEREMHRLDKMDKLSLLTSDDGVLGMAGGVKVDRKVLQQALQGDKKTMRRGASSTYLASSSPLGVESAPSQGSFHRDHNAPKSVGKFSVSFATPGPTQTSAREDGSVGKSV